MVGILNLIGAGQGRVLFSHHQLPRHHSGPALDGQDSFHKLLSTALNNLTCISVCLITLTALFSITIYFPCTDALPALVFIQPLIIQLQPNQFTPKHYYYYSTLPMHHSIHPFGLPFFLFCKHFQTQSKQA